MNLPHSFTPFTGPIHAIQPITRCILSINAVVLDAVIDYATDDDGDDEMRAYCWLNRVLWHL